MLEASNIHKSYQSGNKSLDVLRGVDLEIERGKFIAIVGPSGAGKSTLLHILGGLDSPTKGRVILERQNIYSLDDAQISDLRNRSVGFVFQFYHLLPEFTALENVMMPGLINQRPEGGSQKAKTDALGLLERLGLKDRAIHFPGELSGGEKQRVALARALINNPKFLFCDEPTGNLDSKTGEEIVALINKINLENNMTVVMVTHNEDIVKAADKVYYLKDGVLVN
jgi:lipoprotein-releasing system ATP-binding protein